MLREAETAYGRRTGQQPVRLLLLEDDPHFADLLRTQLRRMRSVDSRLDIAGTLAEALDRLSAESYGLVLADLNLPDATDLQAVEALARSGEQLIIVLTGVPDATLRARALEAGAYDFLSKNDLSAAALERLLRLAAIQSNTYRSLRESEARFRGLVELSSDWYWEQDAELRFTRFEGRSDGMAQAAVGKRRWEVPGLVPVSCSWEEHRGTLQARRAFRNFEYLRPGADGEMRYVSVSGEPLYDALGRFQGYRGVASDMTERKRAEEALRRFRLAMDNSADIIVLVDRATMRFADVNATACRLLGYAREELLQMGPADILPMSAGELAAVYDRMIAAPQAVTGMRSHYRCKDGSPLPFESTRRVMRSGDNWIIAVISRDLRDRLASEKALEESEARKTAILDAAMDAIVTIDHEGRIVELNAAAERDFGYPRAQAAGRDMAELMIPQERRAAHRAGLARLVGGGAPRMLGRRVEVQAMRADGSRFEVELAIVRIPGSEPPLFTGTARDITARKRAEEELQRFRLAMDASADIIVLIDRARMRYVDANRTACTLLGYTREELLAMGPHDIIPVPRAELEASYDALIADPGGPASRTKSSYRCKDGSMLPFESTRQVLRSGESWLVAAISRDMRERLAAEREVARLSRMYAALGAANEAILRAKSAQEVFERACEIAVEAGGFLLGSVVLVDEQGRALSRAASSGPGAAAAAADPPLNHAAQPEDGGIIGEACRAGRAVISNDYRGDSRASRRRGPLFRQVGSAAVFPLFTEGRAAAVFGLLHTERNAFSDELTGLLQRLADDMSFALDSLQRDARLAASEARFRGLTGLSSDMYWAQDTEYRFTEFTGTGPLASRRDAILGKRRWDHDYFNMSAKAWEEHKALLEARRPFRDLELARLNDAGEQVWISVSGEPVFDDTGAFAGYRGVGKEISERKRAERLIALEHRVTRSLAAAETVTGALREIMRAICESENWNSARYFSLDEAAGLLRFEHGWTTGGDAMTRFNDGSKDIAFRTGEGLVGQAWQSGEPLWVADVTRDARVANAALARAAGVHGAFVFPLAFEGRTIGVIAISSQRVREPDALLLQTLRVIGSQLAQFLRRKQAEQRQIEHLHYQEKLSRFGQSALARRQPAELIEEALQILLETLGAEAVAYFEPDPQEHEVVLRAQAGGGAQTDPRSLAAGEDSPVRRVLRTQRRAGAGGAVLVPVPGESHTRGVLCVCARANEPFRAEALNFVEATASVLSTGLLRIDSEGRLAYLAQFDPLTGLPNRALLADRFAQMIVQARRHARPLGVLFIDLDEFKLVNDTLGHAGGDELLKEVAVRLQSSVRNGDTVARISGDEFAVVLADMARTEDAALVAQKIIERLGAPVDVLGHEVFVTASVGIAVFPGDGGDAETLIGAADAAMYRAKQSGRNAYQFFTAEINQRSRARAQLGADLRRALEREEFALVYQPKFRLADRGAGGAEALLRWRHPERGMVSPGEFIPVLEETGLIVPVGEWVLRRACEDLKAWRAAGLAAGPVAVNLSARQFRLPDLDVRLKAVVAATGVDPALIELEITESQLMQDPDHAIRVMRSLREAGMRIAIDDFGTGYSSLAYLTRFPVGSLKIDRSFVASINEDASADAIVRTIIEMAHTLGFTVVAEGIETEAQADYLRRHRCEQGQGYLFARPMAAAELAALLAKHCT